MKPLFHEKLEPIFGRRSIRVYQERIIDKDIIIALLEAAMAAPSAVAKDPWRFVVVQRKDILSSLSSGLPNGKMLASSPLGIVVCGELSAAHDSQLSYMIQDCSAAIENILIAAHILGLGACWLGVHPREERVKHVRLILGIPEAITPISCIAIGYPAEKKEPRTRFNGEYVHFETW